jgi:DprA winged helix domain
MAKLTDINLELIYELYESMLKQFPSDDDCLEFLMYWIIGVIVCNECGSADLDRIDGERHAFCRACKKKTWLTAQSFLERISRPRAYLMALIYRGSGIAISAAELARVCKIVPSTAQCILRKIDFVILNEMAPIGIPLDSRKFSESIVRRSTYTPATKHPVSEFDEIDKKNAQQGNNVQPAPLSPDEKQIYKLLSEQPISIDSLINATGWTVTAVSGTLTMLQLNGLAKALPGDNFAKCYPASDLAAQKISPQTKGFLDRSMELIRSTHQGISRRYLQTYLAFCWSMFDRTRWDLRALLKACRKFGLITDAQLKLYVSPDVVLLAPVP